jgi:hypothetical protein
MNPGAIIQKKWVIELYILNPRNNKLKRQRKYQGINLGSIVKERDELVQKMLYHWIR